MRFRVAQREDAPFLASVLEMAGRGHLPRGPWDLSFPEAAERSRALELLAGDAPRSWCHHSAFAVAEVDGEAGAALVAFESDELGDTLDKALFDVFQRLAWPSSSPAKRMRARPQQVATPSAVAKPSSVTA